MSINHFIFLFLMNSTGHFDVVLICGRIWKAIAELDDTVMFLCNGVWFCPLCLSSHFRKDVAPPGAQRRTCHVHVENPNTPRLVEWCLYKKKKCTAPRTTDLNRVCVRVCVSTLNIIAIGSMISQRGFCLRFALLNFSFVPWLLFLFFLHYSVTSTQY